MKHDITYVGIDSAKKTNDVALLLPGDSEALMFRVANDNRGVRRLSRRLKKEAPGDLVVCYEAGPCGYDLQRKLEAEGIRCLVVAPSMVPVKPGERIKTNRRDALKLAHYLRAGELTEVHPPTGAEEAVRDLCRSRESAREDLTRARHRMSKLLLRKGVHYPGNAWTVRYWQWLRRLTFEEPALQVVFDDCLRQLDHQQERLRGLEAALEDVSQTEPYREPVGWLRCFRGIDTVTAMTVVSELHDFQRFESPSHLMSYLGLVPSENSTGESQRRGAITRSGNKRVRRVLIEASWSYRHRPTVGVVLRKRREGQPGRVIAIADHAQDRLYRRYWKLLTRGKEHNKVTTAIARELAGFIWAALCQGHTMTPRSRPAEGAQRGRRGTIGGGDIFGVSPFPADGWGPLAWSRS